ncbi:phospholipase A2 [Streptomyces sp. NPDC051020]|uniref:phospholipase A2 n=1 Tax=Streptomyces sp. NPDC051020 TaxID=3155409 RepID=UPI00341A0F24
MCTLKIVTVVIHADFSQEGTFVRRSTFPVIAAAVLTLLIPQQPASAAEVPDQPYSAGTIQPIGPGNYASASNTFELAETDVSAGLMGRSHSVVGQPVGVAQAQDAPTSRSDLGVFGPSWEAEFLGGQLNRTLTQGSGSITTTDLTANESTRYDLTDSLAGTNGGSTNTYTATDGSTLVQTVKWDDLAGVLKTTVVETLNVDLATPVTGDDVPVDALGNPIPAADLKPSYTYKQVGGGGDNWRVAAAGNTAYGQVTVSYDSAGRVSTVNEPAMGEAAAQSVKVNYATATTASGETLGDVVGRVKNITVTSGSTVRTQASYSYDGSGLLRKVTNPADSKDLGAYSYDTYDRLATVTNSAGSKWDLTYTGDAAAPAAVQTVGTTPDPTAPVTMPDPQPATDGGIQPSYCDWAMRWIWWQLGECVTSVAHYGWRTPNWRQLPNSRWIMGIHYDHCTHALDAPFGFNFKTACDGHDYAYGVIGNWYKNYFRRMTPDKKLDADGEFYGLLRDQTCPRYRASGFCRTIAWGYWRAVRVGGNPVNGANATGAMW